MYKNNDSSITSTHPIISISLSLTHWGPVTYNLTIIGSDNNNIINWALSNKLQWNFNRNSCIFIPENAFENVVWKMAAILSRSQCVSCQCQTILCPSSIYTTFVILTKFSPMDYTTSCQNYNPPWRKFRQNDISISVIHTPVFSFMIADNANNADNSDWLRNWTEKYTPFRFHSCPIRAGLGRYRPIIWNVSSTDFMV